MRGLAASSSPGAYRLSSQGRWSGCSVGTPQSQGSIERLDPKALASAQVAGERMAWNAPWGCRRGMRSPGQWPCPRVPASLSHGCFPEKLLSTSHLDHHVVSVSKLLSSFCRFMLETRVPFPAAAWKASWLSLVWCVPHLPVK